MVVAALGREIAQRVNEGVEMFFGQVTNGRIGERLGEPAMLDGAIVAVIGQESRSLAFTGACAWLVGFVNSSTASRTSFRFTLATVFR